MPTRFLIIDDELRARNVIRKHIERLGSTIVIGECENPLKAMKVLRDNHIDLIVLDIEMPEMNGLRFLETLKDPPGIILCTAFREYALESFDLEVIDYLLKPVTFERFVRAVNKFYHQRPGGHTTTIMDAHNNGRGFIYVNGNNRIHKIYVDEVQYMEELRNSVRIHLNHKQIDVHSTLQDIEKKLPEGLFIRIQRNCLVAISKIQAFNSTSVELEYLSLSIGKKYKDQTICALNYSTEA